MSRKQLFFRIPMVLCTLVLLGNGTAPAQQTDAETTETPTQRVETRRGDMVSVFSGGIVIPEDVRLRGSVVCVGGDVVIEGTVTQDVIVILGDLEIRGRVDGEVVSVLTDQELTDADIDDNVISVLGSLSLKRSRIDGELVNILSDFDSDNLSSFRGPQNRIGLPWFPSIWALIFWGRLALKLIVFVLLLLVVALATDRIRVIGEEAPIRYVPAFFAGVLGYLALFVLLGLLTITFVGLPLAIVAFYVLRWLGIAGIFYAIGRQLGRALGREMSVAGAVLLTFGLYVVISLAPSPLGPFGFVLSMLIWSIFFLFVDVPAVGLVILTRFGSPRGPMTPAPPPAPLPPLVPPPPGAPGPGPDPRGSSSAGT